MRRIWQAIIFVILVVGFVNPAGATHIVGGEITYKCLGGNTYEIRLDIYQDCINGEPQAIAQDIPAFIGIFNAKTPGSYYVIDSMGTMAHPDEVTQLLVPPNFNNSCVNNPPPTCLRKVTFIKKYDLPANNDGYRIVYVRCCRNATILNINRPSETGATYFCDIPPSTEGICNNSAVFKNYPPQIVCINNPLVYDHSASDADGDSLSYEFCEAFTGGQPGDPKPNPTPVIDKTISAKFGYAPGFSFSRPMLGNPLIQINPTTGIISGTPTIQGRFVVSVCCHEWKHGVMVNTVRREFQFVVTNCSKAVVADIPQFSPEFNTYIVQCKSKTVHFVNHSQGGFAYNWDFGVAGATSTEFEPTYTYPDTGQYIVKLVVNKGSTCPDSISRIVKVYPSYNAEYKYTGLLCPNTDLQFTDLSEATYKPVVSWNWDFGDGATSTDQNPVHAFYKGGDYNVSLISTSVKGCMDTSIHTVAVERFVPFAGNDTIIVRGESINFNATGGAYYTWTPSDRLNFTDINNPTGFYPDTGRYAYNVHIKSLSGCEGNDSIRVRVVEVPSLFVPTGFTPNRDGLNDLLRPITVGYSKIKFFRIFNRWGELVYHTDEFNQGWDGTFKGQTAELGTYFWVLSAVDRFGKDVLIKGDATLIR